MGAEREAATEVVTTSDEWVTATRAALAPLANPERAPAMSAYMKNVAPFLGVPAPERREAQRLAWSPLAVPTSGEVAETASRLFALPEREYAYAACDLVAQQQRVLDEGFLAEPLERLLLTRPWWDTVDALVNAAVCPLTRRHPQLVDLMWQWWKSGDRWLVRAAIGHQRARKAQTDLELLFAMCDGYASDREFFIAKAIGWALRDVSTYFPDQVRSFVEAHADLSPVARREALRKIDRSSPR
jgi:3-methyladenine DNA glycosylase AlkD